MYSVNCVISHTTTSGPRAWVLHQRAVSALKTGVAWGVSTRQVLPQVAFLQMDGKHDVWRSRASAAQTLCACVEVC